jgi:hypothetical protein
VAPDRPWQQAVVTVPMAFMPAMAGAIAESMAMGSPEMTTVAVRCSGPRGTDGGRHQSRKVGTAKKASKNRVAQASEKSAAQSVSAKKSLVGGTAWISKGGPVRGPNQGRRAWSAQWRATVGREARAARETPESM